MLDDLDSAYARTVDSGVDLDAPRDCHLYHVSTWNHDAFMRGQRVRELGYVGESARTPLARLGEHLGETGGGQLAEVVGQPWADLYCGQVVDDVEYGSKRAVLAAEKAAVEVERPRYNVEWNKGNTNRTPPWRAIEERHERDRMLGRPLWQPPRPRAPRAQPAQRAARAPMAAPAARAPRAQPAKRSASARPALRRNRWEWRAGAWLLLSLALWAPGAVYVPLPDWRLLAPAGLLVAALLVSTCPTWRGRRGWRRLTCRRVAWGLVAVAVVVLLGSLPA